MVFFCIGLIMSPLEMVFQSYRLLEPWVYLAFQIYKTLFGLIFTIIEIVAYTRTAWGDGLSFTQILMIVLVVISVGMT
jgi:hypothetical protein